MKHVLAAALSAALLIVSVPAFACGGDHEAKADADETVVTSSTDDTACTEADGTCDQGDKKAKKKATQTQKQTETQSTQGDA